MAAADDRVPAKLPFFTTEQLIDAVRDAAIAAAIALALFLFLVGFYTRLESAGLVLTTRWSELALIVGAVFIGRLFLNLFVWRKRSAAAPKIGRFFGPDWLSAADWLKLAIAFAALLALRYIVPGLAGYLAQLAAIGLFYIPARKLAARFLPGLPWDALVLGVAVAFAVVMPFMPFAGRYWMDQAIVILTYTMLGWGLNIVVGLAGMLDLGYVAFYAVGAYSFALLATNLDLGFWVCLPMAGMLAAGWGLILGFPVLRLRGDYLAIVTLAFGEIIRVVLLNWYDFTNGPDGVSGIPRPTLFGITFERGEGGFADLFGLQYSPIHRIVFLYYIILLLALVTNFVTMRMRRLPIGRAWEALREDEIACRSLGINTTNTKLTAFATGAMFGGFAGSFFATRQGFISPESFTAIESFIILALVVLGGLGSQIGVLIAAILMNSAFELLRELNEFRMLIVGLAIVVIMVWRPRGLISTRQPSIVFRERKTISAEAVSEGRG